MINAPVASTHEANSNYEGTRDVARTNKQLNYEASDANYRGEDVEDIALRSQRQLEKEL